MEEHDSDADIMPNSLLRLEVMLGDLSVHSLLHCLPLESPYVGGEQEGRSRSNQPRLLWPSERHLPLSLLCLVKGMRILMVFKSSETH